MVIKNCHVLKIPNFPSSYDENLNEERQLEVIPGPDNFFMYVSSCMPNYPNFLPTSSCKKESEKEVMKVLIYLVVAE
jgi:hypothetical protein